MNNNSILIDRYLQNEMSAEEKQVFENQLAADPALREELDIQQRIINAAKIAGLKNEFGKAIRKRMLTRRWVRWGLAIIIAAAVFHFCAKKMNWFNHGDEGKKETIVGSTTPERFDINNAADTIIETRDGVVFAIPAHTFNSNSDNIQLEIKTALTPIDIMKYGLSTMSDDNLLRTAGMFSINGYNKGEQLTMNKEIIVNVPATEIDPSMQLFEGVEDSGGYINWVNPKAIEKRLRTYDISQLDFYPPNFIPTVKALGKDHRNKKYTDSLYYSFSGYPHSERPQQNQKIDSVREVPHENEYPNDSTQESEVRPDLQRDEQYNWVNQIDPAKIRAIWDKQFNNTIIATKEFEERLRYMHSICATGIEFYIKNINQPMYKTDEFIAGMAEGEIKNKFLEFAKRKDGSVLVADGMQQKLSDYFYERSKAYREAVEKTWIKYQDSLNALNKIANAKRRTAAMNNFKRENNNFNEELCLNLTAAYQQIGIKRSCKDTIVPPPAKYYNVTISTPGWKNLDVYVSNATESRQSMTYTDPSTGKTATLTYKEVNIRIENRQQYDWVLVYLIPDSLSSFQRVKEQGSNFKENLNSLFKYDAVALAYKGEQAFYYRQQALQPTNYVFNLTSVNTKDLQLVLRDYSLIKSADIITDFEYQLFDQKEVERQWQVQKNMEFRERIARAIFACGEGIISAYPAK